MPRAGAERRMVAERKAPAHAVGRDGKRTLHPLGVLRKVEQPRALEEILLRGVDADELDVRSKPEAIEQSRAERGAAGGFFAKYSLANVEVVLDLFEVGVVFTRRGRV